MSETVLDSPPRPQRKTSIFNSLGARLFLSVLGGSLVGLGFASYLFYQALTKQARAELIATLDVKAENLEGNFRIIENSTKIVADAATTLYEAGERREEVYVNLVGKTLKTMPLGTGLGFGQPPEKRLIIPSRVYAYPYAVRDKNNQVVAKGGDTDPKNYTESYFTEPIAAGKDIWLEPTSYLETTIEPPETLVTTSYALPFYNQQKELLGVINQDVELGFLSDRLSVPVVSDRGYFVLISAKGNLIAYPPDPKLALQLKPFPQISNYSKLWEKIQDNLKSESSGIIFWMDDKDNREYWAYRRIANNNWLLLAAVPEWVVIGPVLGITLGGTLGAAIVLAAVVFWFVKRLNQRLKPIMDECNLIAETNAKTEELMSREDEIGQLTISFYNLLAQVTVNEKRLRKEMSRSEQAFQALQKAQSQVIQNEKMSGLGQLVAGVAHEINNPINFIYGNLPHASNYTQDLLNLINLYQEKYPQAEPEIQEFIEDIELDFLVEDLQKMLASMSTGADRIREIVLSLRNFSRVDESDMKYVNIHEGIDSTLLILQHRLKARGGQSAIQIIKEYGNLPVVECYAGQLNQVFMNIIGNAIDAIENKFEAQTADSSSFIRIHTELTPQNTHVLIRIQDSGQGIAPQYKNKLFDPFFTTKPVGKGTGLGLSISYQIVVEKHKGSLKCISEPEQGAEFLIEIPVSQTRMSSVEG